MQFRALSQQLYGDEKWHVSVRYKVIRHIITKVFNDKKGAENLFLEDCGEAKPQWERRTDKASLEQRIDRLWSNEDGCLEDLWDVCMLLADNASGEHMIEFWGNLGTKCAPHNWGENFLLVRGAPRHSLRCATCPPSRPWCHMHGAFL